MSIFVLPNQLRANRKLAGFNQKEVAYLLGCESGAMITNYECDRRRPNLDHALALGAVFNLSIDELFAGRAIRKTNEVRARAAKLVSRLERAPQSNKTKRKVRSLLALLERTEQASRFS
jgi:transcriptional regulator with XRE-family HTH domain